MNSFRFQIALFLFLLGLSSISYAQKGMLQTGSSQCSYLFKPSNAAELNDSIRSHFAIKFNPIQWLWDEYRFFVELPICDKGSLNFRLGFNNASFLPTESRHTKTDYQYWNSSINSYDTINYSSNGYCLGIGYNYYFGKNNYIQPSFMFKEYWYEFSTLDHWLDAAGNAFWYESEREHRDSFHKKVYSFEIRYGKIFYIHKMLIDLFGGCGVRYKWRKMSIMNDYGVNYESENANSVQTMRTPSLFLGLNIGFVLK